MQRQDPFFGKKIVHRREHEFLIAAAIGRTKDQAKPIIKVHYDGHMAGLSIREVPKPTFIFGRINTVIGE